jgi:hypothetical protein
MKILIAATAYHTEALSHYVLHFAAPFIRSVCLLLDSGLLQKLLPLCVSAHDITMQERSTLFLQISI